MLTIRQAASEYGYCYEWMRRMLAGIKPDDLIGANRLYRRETIDKVIAGRRTLIPIRFRDKVAV